MVVAAASQQDGTPSLIVTATDFIVSSIDSKLLSFIEVYENSILNIHHSHFTHVFTRGTGAVACGDYQDVQINIYDTNFTHNAA